MASRNDEFPLVSIGIPTYNGGKRIHKTLASIWAQNYPNLEILVSDNASTDNTEGVCRLVAAAHPEIKYCRQKQNIGLIANFEFTLGLATGKYFMWVADDDILEPAALFRHVNFLQKNPEYSLVSGQIRYWQGNQLDSIEDNFNLENNSGSFRAIQYYSRVTYGGMFHGLMRRDIAAKVPTRKVFGNDFHFAASMAYLGKVKNLEFPGYNKHLGGFSQDIKKSAIALGESHLASNFPYVKISCDAFAEVMHRSPVFGELRLHKRLTVAVFCMLGVLLNHYGKIYPRALGGKAKRLIFKILGIKDRGSIFKRKTLGKVMPETFAESKI